MGVGGSTKFYVNSDYWFWKWKAMFESKIGLKIVSRIIWMASNHFKTCLIFIQKSMWLFCFIFLLSIFRPLLILHLS